MSRILRPARGPVPPEEHEGLSRALSTLYLPRLVQSAADVLSSADYCTILWLEGGQFMAVWGPYPTNERRCFCRGTTAGFLDRTRGDDRRCQPCARTDGLEHPGEG